MGEELKPRQMGARLEQALGDFPVVVLTGARQTGKTTLVQRPPVGRGRRFLTLDDLDVTDAARRNPTDLVESAPRLTLDEVQREPGLLRVIKRAVDLNRSPGRFLLTGSANLLLMRRVSETLAGRAIYLQLWPMTEAEKEALDRPAPWASFLSAASGEEAVRGLQARPVSWTERIRAGGYPPAALTASATRRHDWFDGYIRTYLERDLQDVSAIENLPDFRRVMKLAAARIGQVVNQSSLGRDAALPNYTVHRYLNLLETSYQIVRLPAFSGSRTKRLVKSPKLYWTDTGLGAHLAGGFEEEDPIAGALLENLVLIDLLAWRETVSPRPELFYRRTHAGEEVDFVLERGRRLLPIEIKRGRRVGLSDARALSSFLAEHPSRAPFGILLYGGDRIEPILRGILAVPLSAVLLG